MTKQPMYEDRIVANPQIMVGEPVVRGTRIPVALVLEYLAANPDLELLFAAFPRLTKGEREDVRACLAYAQALVEAEYHKQGLVSAEAGRLLEFA